MGRQKKNKVVSNIKFKKCGTCPPAEAVKPISAFYKSSNPLHMDGYIPICKECMVALVYDPLENKISLQKLRKLLSQIDRPYIESVLHSAINEYEKRMEGCEVLPDSNKRIVSLYIKNLQTLKQYRDWDFAAGERYAKDTETPPGSTLANNPHVNVDLVGEIQPPLGLDALSNSMSASAYAQRVAQERQAESQDNTPVDEEAVMLFGEGLKPSMYRKLMKKFNWLKQSYVDVTNFHTEALATYTRYKVLEEEAIACGDADAAKQWGTLATKAAENAKINPKQMSKADLNGSVNSFAEISQAIEQAIDVIPILPQFKYKPSDAVDFLIWQYVNYIRRLEGKPECEYADVYKFYDERVTDYVQQYGDPTGIFTNDPTQKNRPQIEKFIELPDDKDTSAEAEEVPLGD